MVDSSKNKKFISIALGMFLGQGMMLVAQTVLVNGGQVGFVGEVGILIGALSFCQWYGDAGGVYILQKFYTDGVFQKAGIGFLILARTVYALLFLISCIIYYAVAKDASYLIQIILVVFISIFNIGPLFDAGNKVHFFAPLASLPWIFCSSLLLFGCVDLKLIAWAYFFGVTATVLLQWVFAKLFYGLKINILFDKVEVGKLLKISAGILMSGIVGQMYARLFPIVLGACLGNVVAGFYVAAKSYSNAVSQIIAVALRSNYKDLLHFIDKNDINGLFRAQKMAPIISFFGLCLSIVAYVFLDDKNIVFYKFLVALQFCTFVWSFGYAFGQVFIGSNKTKQYFIVNFVSAVGGVSFFLGSNDHIGIYSPLVSELFMSLLQILLFYIIFRRGYVV